MTRTISTLKLSEPRDKDYWLSDEKGLRLLVKASGARYWCMKYRFGGKQKTLAPGIYPDISLREARLARDRARLQLAEGVDPVGVRQADKRAQQLTDENRRKSGAYTQYSSIFRRFLTRSLQAQ